MQNLIIDTPNNVTKYLPLLKSAGIQSIGRYVTSTPHSWKMLSPAEYKEIHDAGFKVFFIFEINGKPMNYAQGARDGKWCNDNISILYDVPQDGTVDLAYTFDYDPQILAPSVDAAQGFKDAAPGFKLWAYASGAVCQALHPLGYNRWLTCSIGFKGSKQALATGQYEMHQTQCDKKFATHLDVDYDAMKDGVPIIGN